MDRAELSVEVVYCPEPGRADHCTLRLPEGSTLDDALSASGLLARHALHRSELQVGIWCRAQEGSARLRDGDRVEVYRALKVDPKEARRLRYKGRKARAAVG